MPIERPDRNNPRPLKPTLASNRTAKTTPLTPRLAVAPTASSTVSSTSTRTARSSNGTTPRPSNDNVTPVKAFLSSNITPRSSSRKSRVGGDSATSTPSVTPSATPNNSRPTSTIDFHKEQGTGYSAHGTIGKAVAGTGRPRSTVGQNSHTTSAPRAPPLAGIYNQTQSEVGSRKDTSPRFFHANDARPHDYRPAPPQAEAPVRKAPTFFYADGREDDTPSKQSAPSPPLSAVSRSHSISRPQSGGPQFFHADSVPESKGRRPILTPPPIPTSPELLPAADPSNEASLRPPSPSKDFAHLSYRKGASQVRPAISRGSSGNSALAIFGGHNGSDVGDRNGRRSSVASTIKRGHVKSSSLSSIDSVTSLRKSSTNEPTAMAPSPLHAEKSVSEKRASAPSPYYTAFSPLGSPIQESPKRNSEGKTPLEIMNELAANARRERKVLDLEISNSSLLAINRSLEKEIRKQKAELRRFRRMSRAGHFAMDHMDSLTETSAIGSASVGNLSDIESSLDDSALSPGAQQERDEAHRARDEKRLQLDLSKHRDMLNDSQKMNQSLRRCLGWTEQLIKDGQKALEYKVNVSDVKLGGRVLISEDDNEIAEAEESKGLLSPWSPMHQAIDALESPFFPGLNSNRVIDRDSGVDLEGLDAVGQSTDNSRTSSPRNKTTSPVKEFRPSLPGTWVSYATNPRESEVKKHESLSPLGSPFEERIRHLHASIDALEAS
ncbi:hypothetical protein PtrSN002B_002878 [Pyrenophora tritici-repentis]|uniref:Herpes-BLLF1 multi-domain protein n=1 Tax=Pyrenophora tritici-repentis TaxID=45151 RepID=A0A2W1G5Q4_9PLEO|nr:Herpes-BLLF1 multi-domain protein [Pyrenophora tritici-repentis]KAI0582293.1 hypothetical protein Alg215_04225 [Pyrenophora tritici-repentis]KAI0585408.1 hypothetical protein Alg130_04776 [Pyrenophora tritici-repentis]KAI0606400.1 hypothetical protein TUN205_09362 [Pyrenophora tritici-repentis]KAI0624286.1 hypothetical protein TUN199_03736 [Pyrenophora tritici-repentis]